jgi:formate C-acetyltransferase
MKRVDLLKEQIIRQAPSISPERAETITEYYRRSEGEPALLRRARVLDEVLAKKSVYILDGELVVGNQSVRPRAAEIFPEFSVQWVLDELDDFALRDSDAFQIDEETKERLRACLPWWAGRTVRDRALAKISPEAIAAHTELVYILTSLGSGIGHLSIDYEKCVTRGVRAIMTEAFEREKAIDGTGPEDGRRREFYQAVRIVCEAVIKYARRFSVLAEEMAVLAPDPARKKELEELARICRKVPEYPAETYHEAAQSFWFAHLVLQIESNGHSISPGRFDQYMFPYYEADLRAGRITREFAKEITENIWVKLNEIIKVRDKTGSKAFGGYPMFQNLIVGGVDENGRDCVNDLSYLCMEVTRELKLPQPSFSVRWHSGAPREYMRAAAEIVRAGIGMPAFFNDGVIVPMLEDLGYTRAEARGYAEVGCVEPQAPGTTEGYYPSGFLNLGKVLEITLNNGVNPVSGNMLGLQTGSGFETFEDFYAAFKRQLGYFCRLQAAAIDVIDRVNGELAPVPFCSCFVADCVARGLDIRQGGARYNFSSPNAVAIANAADALLVVKNAVFRDKIISYADMRNVLLSNFEGREGLRRRFLNAYPKYGNDDDEADFFARDIAAELGTIFREIPNVRSGRFLVGLQSISAHALFAGSIGATPDGRKADTLLADGGCSPAQGRDTRGPTAVMRSVAKIDHSAIPNGTLLNIKLHPSLVESEKGIESLIDLVESFFLMKGQHVQFNVVGAETLRRAQEDPPSYRDLVVRVAGFSVYFTAIDRVLQEDIIRRTEQAVF